MAYSYGIGPNPYVTSILTSILTQECVHKPFLRSQKNDLKKWVLEFVALVQTEGEVGPTLLGQPNPNPNPNQVQNEGLNGRREWWQIACVGVGACVRAPNKQKRRGQEVGKGNTKCIRQGTGQKEERCTRTKSR